MDILDQLRRLRRFWLCDTNVSREHFVRDVDQLLAQERATPDTDLKELIESWRSLARDKKAAPARLRLERQDLPADFWNYMLEQARMLDKCADELDALAARASLGPQEKKFPPVQLQDGASPEWTCPKCGGDALFCKCKSSPSPEPDAGVSSSAQPLPANAKNWKTSHCVCHHARMTHNDRGCRRCACKKFRELQSPSVPPSLPSSPQPSLTGLIEDLRYEMLSRIHDHAEETIPLKYVADKLAALLAGKEK